MQTTFSPLSFIRQIAPPIPLFLQQKALDAFCTKFIRKHPTFLERLDGLTHKSLYCEVLDLQTTFLVSFEHDHFSLTVQSCEEKDASLTTVSASLQTFAALSQGDVDGDALFFQRDLTIDGDTQAIVALRNALDNENINIIDELSEFIPLSTQINKAFFTRAFHDYDRANSFLEDIQQTLLSPLQKQNDLLVAELSATQEQLSDIEKTNRTLKRDVQHLKQKLSKLSRQQSKGSLNA